MAYLRTVLVVLTLLQLLRAEVSDTLPEPWYSANVIQDGFQPKPISELFSTETTFLSTNPIVVLSKSDAVSEEIGILPTLTPPSTQTSLTNHNVGLTQVLPLTESAPSTPELPQPQPQSQPTQIAVQIQTEPRETISSESIPPVIQPAQPDGPQNTPSTSSQAQSQRIRLEIVPQIQLLPNQSEPETLKPITQPPSPQPSSPQPSSITPQSNYFLIYQQAPQSIQNFKPPQSPSLENIQVSSESTTSQPVPSILMQPIPTTTIQSARSTSPQPSTVPTTVISQTGTVTQFPTTTFRTLGRNRNFNMSNSRPATRITTPIPQPVPIGAFPLRIRVVAPSGSITNVNINPTSTTKRPTTTRTRKLKKNNYQVCIDSCKGKREPICAAPRSTGVIDSKTLKGFPSVCHMACHNSFRKEIYERLVDGRCGRLRTRIRTSDSNTKLKRQELIKTEYTVENLGPKTVIELSGPI